MEMRKYLVTVHKDGRITAVEYEEPQGFVYGSASITASCADSASGAIAANAGMFGRKSKNETAD